MIIALISWVGYDTRSEELTRITNWVFMAQFFNTGFLLLLVNANITEHSPKYLTKHFANSFYDYEPQWYANVGKMIVQTMAINSLMPYIGLFTTINVPKIMRCIKCKSNDPMKTTETSMSGFKTNWIGGEYLIHYKQSDTLNIVYVTMMYGIGMPILFPLAAFNFLNQWICERMIVAWYMRLPPSLDNTMMNNFISKVRFAPLFMIFNGYWMISNQQIFENKWFWQDSKTQGMKSGHYMEPSLSLPKMNSDTGKLDFKGVSHAAPIQLVAIVSVILLVI